MLRDLDALRLLNFNSIKLYEIKARKIEIKIPNNFHKKVSKKKKFKATKIGQCHKYNE